MTRPLQNALTAQGMDQGDVFAFLSNLLDIVNELQTDHASWRTVVASLKTLANAVQASFQDGLLAIGTLAIDNVATKFQTTGTAYFRLDSIQYSKAVATALTFTAAHVVSATKFGVILIQVEPRGTISTKVPTATQAYADAPTALAALPAADAGNVALGYIAIEAGAADWTANTDDLTNGSGLTTATFVDATPLTAFTAATVSDSPPAALSNSTPLSLTP